ncbi:MAG: hypothetical protein HKN39_04855 [Flavobacteriales bacterium]|nr:hypothetical protein [Flavobacteriales bacterium]
MGISEIFGYLGALLLAALKFAFTPPTMILAGQSITETLLVTLSGATLGAIVFFYGGRVIFDKWNDIFFKNKVRKKFTKGNRRLIKIKHKFGLVGICISVVILSIPVVAFVLARFYRHDKKALPYLIFALFGWTILLTYGSFYLKDTIAPWFE